MERISSSEYPPRTPSPQTYTKGACLSTSPQTPSSALSAQTRVNESPITPPSAYVKANHPTLLTGPAQTKRISCKLEETLGEQSPFRGDGHVLLFNSSDPLSGLSLENVVGQGQWSRVSRATNICNRSGQHDSHVYAVKVPDSKFATKVIRHEARILTSLSSIVNYTQHIITFYGFDLWYQALVLEYFGSPSGLSLNQAMAARIYPPLTMTRDLIHGLAFIHNAQVIHGDIKPENIYVRCVNLSHSTWSTDGLVDDSPIENMTKYEAVYSDFSAARFDSPGSLPAASAGTFDYMAPELFSTSLQDSYPTKASDVYALGVTLIAAVAGQSPYESASNSFARRAMAMQGIPLRFLTQDIGAANKLEASGITPVLTTALAKDPERRCNAELWKHIIDHHLEQRDFTIVS